MIQKFILLPQATSQVGVVFPFLPPPRQPAAARVARDSLCLPRTVPHRLRRNRRAPNNLAASFGVNRPGYAEPDHASFSVVLSQCHKSSHRSRSVGQRSLPGERRLKTFLPIRWPIRQSTLCKVAAFASTLRCRYAYGYITQAIVRRAPGGGSSRQDYATRSPFPAQVR